MRICGHKAKLVNLKSGRDVTASEECKIEVLEGMAVRMNKRDIDVRCVCPSFLLSFIGWQEN